MANKFNTPATNWGKSVPLLDTPFNVVACVNCLLRLCATMHPLICQFSYEILCRVIRYPGLEISACAAVTAHADISRFITGIMAETHQIAFELVVALVSDRDTRKVIANYPGITVLLLEGFLRKLSSEHEPTWAGAIEGLARLFVEKPLVTRFLVPYWLVESPARDMLNLSLLVEKAPLTCCLTFTARNTHNLASLLHIFLSHPLLTGCLLRNSYITVQVDK